MDRLDMIVLQTIEGAKDARNFHDADVSKILEDYITAVALDRIDECRDEDRVEFPDFKTAGSVIQGTSVIYARQVDFLYVKVLESRGDKDVSADVDDTNGGPANTKRTKKTYESLEFKAIALQEANNISMKDNSEDAKPVPSLPKAFMQFEPRVMSDNDVQLLDHRGEVFGLMSDFRVNWNTDEDFTLCDDMDFCTADAREVQMTTDVPLAISPTDSGHSSDYSECIESKSPDVNSLCSMAADCMALDSAVDSESDTMIVADTTIDTTIVADATIDTTIVADTTVAVDTTITPDTPMDTIVASPNILPSTPTTLMSLLKKPPVTKFDMTTPLSGSLDRSKIIECDFSLPSNLLQKSINQRKAERKSLKRFLTKMLNDSNLNEDLDIAGFSPCKKKCPMTWSRQEACKKLKLIEMNSNIDVKGFQNSDDVKQSLKMLEKSCSRLTLSSMADDSDIFSDDASPNCADDDTPDNCCIGTNNLESSIATRLLKADFLNSTASNCTDQGDLAKRVEAWHASLQEKLKFSENRKDFTVKEYEKDILSKFSSNQTTSKLNFSDLIHDKPQEEISRYFLTTLMMATESQIVIDEPPQLSCGDFQFSRSSEGKHNRPHKRKEKKWMDLTR